MSKIIDNGDSQIITVEAGHYVKIAWLGGTYTLTAVAGGLPNLPAVQGTANSAADQTFGPYTSAVTMKLQVSAIGAAAWDSGATPVFEPPGDTFVRQSDGVPVTLTGTGTGAAFTSAVDGAGNTYATFAAIPTPPPVGIITVSVDETNAGQRTLYSSDGVSLTWIVGVGV